MSGMLNFMSPARRTLAPQGQRQGDSAKPMQLVYTDAQGRFVMDLDAVSALRATKGPIGVVAVCGRARQGKSFILNQLLGRSSGFQVGPSVRPCTKGLWMWSAPVPRKALDGSTYHLVLLDTEGIDSYDQTGTYSTQIFSLAVLLSSLFVYNQMGGIDEAALDRLSLVTEMTKRIRVKAGGASESSVQELAQYSPDFLWLLRDFYLDLEEDGRKITAREYLEIALRPATGADKSTAAKNAIRESIRALFPDRDCFTLVRPVNDEKELQHLDSISMERMRPEFRQGMEALTKTIFARARPKRMGDAVLTGPMLAALTQSYLQALNAGAVPTIASSWQSVEEGECRRAFDSGLAAYSSAFDSGAAPEEGALRTAHDVAVQEALRVFAQEALGVGALRQQYEDRLRNALAKQFQEHSARAFAEAELRCASALGNIEARLLAAARADGATVASFGATLDTILAEYEAAAAGPAKWQRLATFLRTSVMGMVRDVEERREGKVAAEVAAARAELAAAKAAREAGEEKLTAARQDVDASRAEVREWKARYEDSTARTHAAGQQLMDVQKLLRAAEERARELTPRLEQSEQERARWQQRHTALLEKHAALDKSAKGEAEKLQQKLALLEDQLQRAEKGKEELQKSGQRGVEDLRSQHQVEVQRLRQQILVLETGNSGALRQKDERIGELQARLEAARSGEARHATLAKEREGEVARVQGELARQRTEVSQLDAAVRAAEARAAGTGEELQAVLDRRASAEARLHDAVQRAKRAEDERDALSQRNGVLLQQAREQAAEAEFQRERLQRAGDQAVETSRRAERAEDRLRETEALLEAALREKEDARREGDGRAQAAAESVREEGRREAVAMQEQLEGEVRRLEGEKAALQEQLQGAGDLRARFADLPDGRASGNKRGTHQELSCCCIAFSGPLLVASIASEAVPPCTCTAIQNAAKQAKPIKGPHPQLLACGSQLQVPWASASSTRARRTKLGWGNLLASTRIAGRTAAAEDEESAPHGPETHARRRQRTASNGVLLPASRTGGLGQEPAQAAEEEPMFDAQEGPSEDRKAAVEVSQEPEKLTKNELKQQLTKAGHGHEVLNLRNPSKGDLVLLYRKRLLAA